MKKNKPKILSFDDAVATVKEGRRLKKEYESRETDAIAQMRQYCIAVLQDLLCVMKKAFDILGPYPELKYDESNLTSVFRTKFTVGYHPAEFRYLPQIAPDNSADGQMYPTLITHIQRDGCALEIPGGFGYEPHKLSSNENSEVPGFSTMSVKRVINHLEITDMAIGNWINYRRLIKAIVPIPKLIRDAVVYSAQRFQQIQSIKLDEMNELVNEKYVPVIWD